MKCKTKDINIYLDKSDFDERFDEELGFGEELDFDNDFNIRPFDRLNSDTNDCHIDREPFNESASDISYSFNEEFIDNSNICNDGSEFVKYEITVETSAKLTEEKEKEDIIINDNRENEQQSGKDFFLFICGSELADISKYLVIEQKFLAFLASLLDNEGNWTWGCGTIIESESESIDHHGDLTPLPNQYRVGPREWGETRLERLFADDGAVLPDYLNASVLPQEANGALSLSYREISENIKKQRPLPFSHSERQEWLSNYGLEFHKMMTGDYGDGVHHLQFDIGDVYEQIDPELRGKSSLFQSNDVDSGMGWLPSLGTIKTDVKLFLYPFSSRNFDANIHLFMDINGKPVQINEINHFLLGEFGNIGCRPCQLFLFLPSMYNPGTKGNGVTDHHKDAFISQCFIPAAEEVLGEEAVGEFLKEQLRRNMREIKMNCEAPMYEGQIHGSAGNRLAGSTHIPQIYLADLWKACMMKLEERLEEEDEDFLPFKGCRLFWSFKGFKYTLAEANDEELERTFESKVKIFPFLVSC